MPSLRQLPLLTLFLGLRFRELDERALWDGDGLDGIGVGKGALVKVDRQ